MTFSEMQSLTNITTPVLFFRKLREKKMAWDSGKRKFQIGER